MTISRSQFLGFIRKSKEIGVKEDALTSATRYYLRNFDRHGKKGGFISWNWPAALFPVSWLLYRRMYLFGFLYMLLRALAFLWIDSPGVGISFFLVMGLFGNALYFFFIKYKLSKGVTHLSPSGLALLLSLIFAPLVGSIILIISSKEREDFHNLKLHYKITYAMEGREGVLNMKSFDEKFREYLESHYQAHRDH